MLEAGTDVAMPIAEEVLLGLGVSDGRQVTWVPTSPIIEPVQYGSGVVLFVVQEVVEVGTKLGDGPRVRVSVTVVSLLIVVNIVVVDSMLEVDVSTNVMTPLEQQEAPRDVSTEVTVRVIGVQAQTEAAREDDETELTT